MKLERNECVINIMEKTLDYVDPRLMDHGKRVAYLIFKLLEQDGGYNENELRNICVLAMLHDVGAYKTEEIDRLVEFETRNVWEHSIYGYLFLKHFSPLKELSPAILCHHANCGELEMIEPFLRSLANIIFICDRADVFSHGPDNNNRFRDFIEKKRGILFYSDVVDLFLSADIDIDKINEGIKRDKNFTRVFYETPVTEEEVIKYIKMTILSIEFRSSQTVLHTITTACISRVLAELAGIEEHEIKKITTGAMLHDIGKTGIPLSILESPNRLTDDEMIIMRTHVDITEKILDGNVSDDIKKIAVRHHEKMNGTGYPRKLDDLNISTHDYIVAAADIFSALCGSRSYKDPYPKEKIISVFKDLKEKNLLHPEVIDLAMKHFDIILEEINRETQPVIEAYEKINEEYLDMLEKIKAA